MRLKPEIIGLKINRLTAIEYFRNEKQNRRYVKCACDCGGEAITPKSSFLRGRVNSCGCYQKQRVSETFSIHKLTDSYTYTSWRAMRQRLRPSGSDYRYYKNIKMDPRWNDYLLFLEDMGERPKGMTLERINNKGNYCKSNCRWASRLDQSRNTSKTIKIIWNGKQKRLRDVCSDLGIRYRSVLSAKYKTGRTFDESIKSLIAHKKNKQMIKKIKTFNSDINYETIKARLKRGWTLKDACTIPLWSKK